MEQLLGIAVFGALGAFCVRAYLRGGDVRRRRDGGRTRSGPRAFAIREDAV